MAEKDQKSKQRIRLQRFGLAVATYATMGSAGLLVTRLGLGEMSRAQWMTFIIVGLLGNSVFFLLFVTGWNLKFRDPSLTWAQIFYSAVWGMLIVYDLPEARPIILMFFVPAFSFGMLRLTRRQYFTLTGSVLGLYALLLGFEALQGRPAFRVNYELFLFALFGILLTWFSFFGGFVSHIRHRLNIQKAEFSHSICPECAKKLYPELDIHRKK